MMSREKGLETILVLCVALIVLFLIFEIKLLLFASLALGLTGMFSGYLSNKIAWAWLKLAEGLGFIVSKILLTLLFFVFLLPLALLSRLFSKNKMRLKKQTEGSYYVIRNHEFSPIDLEKMW